MTREQLDQAFNVVAEISRLERELIKTEKTYETALLFADKSAFKLNMPGMMIDDTRISRAALMAGLQEDVKELTSALDQAKLKLENL